MNMQSIFDRFAGEVVRQWLPFAVIATFLSGLVYVAVQQDMRSGANDPQIQIAEDIAAVLQNGIAPQSVIPPGLPSINIGKSLSPYVIIFDDSGKPIAGTGQLEGKLPTPPPRVFEYARKNGENRLTWQPEPAVRSAIVVIYYATESRSGFVLAGRSLREVEKRESFLITEVFLGWLASLFISLGIIMLLKFAQSPENIQQ